MHDPGALPVTVGFVPSTLSVKARLSLAFGTLTLLTVAMAGLALADLNQANARFTGYVEGINARMEMVSRIRSAVDDRAVAARNMVIATDTADIAREKAAAVAAQQDVEGLLSKLTTSIAAAQDSTTHARELVAEIGHVEERYGPVAMHIVELAADGHQDEARQRIATECRPLLAALIKATNDYAASTHSREESVRRQIDEHYRSALAMMIGLCAFALAASLAAGFLITRSLRRSLGAEPDALNQVTQRIAAGDLGPVPGAAHAPAGSILAAMGAMQEGLVRLVAQLRDVAAGIATGSSEIALGNADLSARTEQQAAALQETASSMEQLTATVQQNADNARQASVLAGDATTVAVRGNQAVGQVVDTMTEISANSTRIADITGIIDGIAFQTNILALNAAVEAARAGEQGRGFAVVASEVRSLAHRSSTAAKEIRDLIATSVRKIQDGSSLATDAGKTMHDVTQAVTRVTTLMQEFATTSQEQSRGIEQASLAISQMDGVVQQNAALVEQAAAASHSLEDQGRHLNAAMAMFHV
ncbi:methyl-accepting chemotaxis protein [Robbsia sp. Bb-Pol-6]|uniref:Methyl-accepting chemotaxis protein n=1 Tax=Robbsia betulipollinis TaxID=2981849 RepID=A0ABT3ZJD7_9BURK|nr:methyl-accepting chemotaxis protein [Robbsia betulipollinis]MCY0386562.1 methyl-accepting chemotaxis protein [Robbsia betulipollinis]